MQKRVKIDEFTAPELTYVRLAYELELPIQAIMVEMGVHKSYLYIIKKKAEEKLEKQYRRYKIA